MQNKIHVHNHPPKGGGYGHGTRFQESTSFLNLPHKIYTKNKTFKAILELI